MKFRDLAQYFEKIEKTSSRLEITSILAGLFNKLSLEEIDKSTYLLQGRIVPLFEKLEFCMAEKMVIKSICLALNLDRKLFEHEYKKIGDIGQTVEKFKGQIQLFDEHKDLTIKEVYDQLYFLAKSEGMGSQDIKIKILANLIRQLDSLSVKFVVRIPIGVMRLGFSDMTILDAFSWMLVNDKSLRSLIQEAYHVRPDLGYIGHELKNLGKEGLSHIKPVIGTPIIMMKAERMSSGGEVIKQIGQCAIQPKYDGLRLQIHYSKKDDVVKIYSRNLDEVSSMFPDIVRAVKTEVKAEEIIFEGEAIGFDPQTGLFLPFQETVQRKRKYNIEEKAKEIPLKLFAFELLYANKLSHIKTKYGTRRKILEKHIQVTGDIFKDTILITPEKIIDDPKEIEIEFDDAVSKGLEGIIAKKLAGVYEPGARGWNWIKYKKSYSSKIEDTIDCLIMGYDFGKGKRTNFGIGAFLVGIYDEKQEKYYTVAKIGTGLTDKEWKQLQVKSQKSKVKNQPINYMVDEAMKCDVWTRPKIVVEIRADEISRSPVHTAGRVMRLTKTGNAEEIDTSGFALRFPRLERFRDDKKPEQATTLKEIERLFNRQGSK